MVQKIGACLFIFFFGGGGGQQKSVADHLKKPVVHPIIVNNFLAHVQIDLIDMRSLTCSCSEGHKWILNIMNHHTSILMAFSINFQANGAVV